MRILMLCLAIGCSSQAAAAETNDAACPSTDVGTVSSPCHRAESLDLSCSAFKEPGVVGEPPPRDGFACTDLEDLNFSTSVAKGSVRRRIGGKVCLYFGSEAAGSLWCCDR